MIRKLAVALTVLLLLAACQGSDDAGGDGTAAAQPSFGAAPDGVTVTGQGRVPGEPETLRAIVGVHVSRPDVAEAFDDAATASEEVLEAIREQGVDEEDIQTRDFSVRPEHEHPPPPPPDGPPGPPGPPELSGYAVRNVVEVTVRDVDQASELLAAVTDAGGDDVRVEGLRFSLEDDEDRFEAAREAAFDDARAKAEHYAELTGAELGELVNVTELGGPHPPPHPGPAPPPGVEPPILPGEEEVGVQLRATWALQ